MRRKIEDISIINEGLVIDGSVVCDGRLIVRGTLKGSLSGETVVVADTGSVSASVQAASITIGGTFEGEVFASDELIVLSTGQCSGRVVCRNLVVEAGGRLTAEVKCIEKTDSPELPTDEILRHAGT